MKLNLDSLRAEIQEYLEPRSIAVFHSRPRIGDDLTPVLWDTDRYPDFRLFLAAAEAAGVKLVTLYAREFADFMIEDALEHMATSDLPRDERRAIDKRLREMRGYSGFTCQIELSFDLSQRVFVFELSTDWYNELHDLMDRIEDEQPEEGLSGEDERGPLGGGYFSKN